LYSQTLSWAFTSSIGNGISVVHATGYVFVLDIALDIALDIYKDIVIDIAHDIIIDIAYDVAYENAQ